MQLFSFYTVAMSNLRTSVEKMIREEASPRTYTVFVTSHEISALLQDMDRVDIMDPIHMSTKGAPVDTNWIWTCDIPITFMHEVWSVAHAWPDSSVCRDVKFLRVEGRSR